ncbi:MAG: hypothetical protein ACPGVP_04990 [Thiolinea sp.]
MAINTQMQNKWGKPDKFQGKSTRNFHQQNGLYLQKIFLSNRTRVFNSTGLFELKDTGPNTADQFCLLAYTSLVFIT